MIKLSSLTFLLILLLSTIFGGCSKSLETEPLKNLSQSDKRAVYRAAPGDLLSVKVWGEPRLSGDSIVRSDGRITLQLAGDVMVEGLTIKQITAKLNKQFKEYIPATSVTVSVLQTAPIKYYLLGSFNKPGEYRSESRITLLQAIATGGGFAPFAEKHAITLIRQSGNGEKRYVLDYSKVTHLEQPNPILRSGDIVSVE